MGVLLIALLVAQIQLVSAYESKLQNCDARTLSQGYWQPCDANGVRTRFDELGQWRCYPGIQYPIRMNAAGDVECMSSNFRDCLLVVSCENTLAAYASSRLNPASCGINHVSMWGTSGYDEKNSWCSNGRSALADLKLKQRQPQQKCLCTCDADAMKKTGWSSCDAKGFRSRTNAYEWSCPEAHWGQPSWTWPVRLTKYNQVECMSMDHHSCITGKNCQVLLAADYSVLQPIHCGAMAIIEYGVTGYTPDNWCIPSLNYLSKLPVVEKCKCVYEDHDDDHQHHDDDHHHHDHHHDHQHHGHHHDHDGDSEDHYHGDSADSGDYVVPAFRY